MIPKVSPRPVLLVDDDVRQLRQLRLGLKRAGFQVETALSGSQGLEMIGRIHPLAVVLDLDMPEMNGFTFLKILRRKPAYRKLPVIVLTGCSPSTTLLESYDRGSDLYLTKPVEMKQLIEAIHILGG